MSADTPDAIRAKAKDVEHDARRHALAVSIETEIEPDLSVAQMLERYAALVEALAAVKALLPEPKVAREIKIGCAHALITPWATITIASYADCWNEAARLALIRPDESVPVLVPGASIRPVDPSTLTFLET